jgi:site-specific DNA recombinase
LVVNEAEAERVRAIFALYLELKDLLPVVQELDGRGWVNKQRTTGGGRVCCRPPPTSTSGPGRVMLTAAVVRC